MRWLMLHKRPKEAVLIFKAGYGNTANEKKALPLRKRGEERDWWTPWQYIASTHLISVSSAMVMASWTVTICLLNRLMCDMYNIWPHTQQHALQFPSSLLISGQDDAEGDSIGSGHVSVCAIIIRWQSSSQRSVARGNQRGDGGPWCRKHYVVPPVVPRLIIAEWYFSAIMIMVTLGSDSGTAAVMADGSESDSMGPAWLSIDPPNKSSNRSVNLRFWKAIMVKVVV